MPMSVLWRVLWPLEAWGQRRADAGLGSGSGRVLGVNGGGDGGHSHAHFWAQAQVVRAQWRVQVQASPGMVQWPGQVQPWDFLERNDAKAETPVLWPSHAKS